MAVPYSQSLTPPKSEYAIISSAGVKVQEKRKYRIKGKKKPYKTKQKSNKPYKGGGGKVQGGSNRIPEGE